MDAFQAAADAVFAHYGITPAMVDAWAATRAPPVADDGHGARAAALLQYLLRDLRLPTIAATKQYVVTEVAAIAAENQQVQARQAAETAASGGMWTALGFDPPPAVGNKAFWLPGPHAAFWDAATWAVLQPATCRNEGGHWVASHEC
jgi:hypothetical protein